MSTSLAELGVSTCESTVEKMKNHCPKEMWQNLLTCLQEKMAILRQTRRHDQVPARYTLMSTNPKKLPLRSSASQWILAQWEISSGGSSRTTTVILQRASSPLTPILCFHEKDPCPDQDDFDRKNLNEFERFSGFAGYIYWSEEA